MRTEFLCISVLRVASGSRVKLASCKSALNHPVVYSTDRSKVVVPVLVLLFVALWFILRDDLFYVLPCVILFLCFFSLYTYIYIYDILSVPISSDQGTDFIIVAVDPILLSL